MNGSNAGERGPVRLGLVGVGRWGQLLSTKLDHHGELVAVCGTGRAGGREWVTTNLHGVPYVTGVDDLLAMALDAVVVASPRSTHESLAQAALDAGVHALVEKPLALRADAAVRLQDRARELGLVLAVDYTHVYDTSFDALRRRVDDGEPLELTWQRPGLATVDDVLYELCPHVVSMAVALDPLVQVRHAELITGATATCVDARLEGPTAAIDARVSVGHVPRLKRLVARRRAGDRTLVWTDMVLEERRGKSVLAVARADEEPLDRVLAAFVSAVAARQAGRTLHQAWPPSAVSQRTPELLEDLISLVGHPPGSITDAPSPSS